jgi:4'-phosphopantetheinyl transferase
MTTPATDDGRVHVWHADPGLAADPDARRACLDLLDGAERERMGRFRFEADATAYLAAHALLRSALSLLAPVEPRRWRFRAGARGKPFVEEPGEHRGLSFSLSHTAGRVAVAVASSGPVGIDVEHAGVARSLLENPERFLSPSEAGALRALPVADRPDRFLACWTLKESYLKASGLGLSVPVQAVSFHLDPGTPIRVSFEGAIQDDPEAWHFLRFAATRDHPAAVAARCAPGTELSVRVLEAARLPLGGSSRHHVTPNGV